MTDFLFFLSCVHVSTIVNILFVPEEVTKTVSYSFSLRPLSTRQSIYVNVWVSLCVHICVCLYWCRAAQGAFSTKQIAVGAVWSVVISRREAETLKVTTVAPLMPVNVTEARTQSFSLNLCACLWKLSIQRHS